MLIIGTNDRKRPGLWYCPYIIQTRLLFYYIYLYYIYFFCDGHNLLSRSLLLQSYIEPAKTVTEKRIFEESTFFSINLIFSFLPKISLILKIFLKGGLGFLDPVSHNFWKKHIVCQRFRGLCFLDSKILNYVNAINLDWKLFFVHSTAFGLKRSINNHNAYSTYL